jgi:hypothetical protein
MTIELKPEQERMIREHMASEQFHSVDEVLTTALASLPHDLRFDPQKPPGRCPADARIWGTTSPLPPRTGHTPVLA